MRVFGLTGWSGSGKTTLMAAIVPELIARGITVSTVKQESRQRLDSILPARFMKIS
jgi:molybdopterin-guanine dinucleotide biosynthesis protein MobB